MLHFGHVTINGFYRPVIFTVLANFRVCKSQKKFQQRKGRCIGHLNDPTAFKVEYFPHPFMYFFTGLCKTDKKMYQIDVIMAFFNHFLPFYPRYLIKKDNVVFTLKLFKNVEQSLIILDSSVPR